MTATDRGAHPVRMMVGIVIVLGIVLVGTRGCQRALRMQGRMKPGMTVVEVFHVAGEWNDWHCEMHPTEWSANEPRITIGRGQNRFHYTFQSPTESEQGSFSQDELATALLRRMGEGQPWRAVFQFSNPGRSVIFALTFDSNHRVSEVSSVRAMP